METRLQCALRAIYAQKGVIQQLPGEESTASVGMSASSSSSSKAVSQKRKAPAPPSRKNKAARSFLGF